MSKISADQAGAPLRFEHLVEVDSVDSVRATGAAVGIERLWRGLRLRMEFPQNFQPALDECEVQVRDDGQLLRTLHFGAQIVRDRVQLLEHEMRIAVDVLAEPDALQARMSMQIEQPAGGGLWVRFCYAVCSPDHCATSPLSELVKDAWRQADEETVFRIRQLAMTGVLDSRSS